MTSSFSLYKIMHHLWQKKIEYMNQQKEKGSHLEPEGSCKISIIILVYHLQSSLDIQTLQYLASKKMCI